MQVSFDPSQMAAADSGLFGLPMSEKDSLIVVIPVPWEVTTSYGDGAARGPAAVLRASHQVDLFDIETGDAYMKGYFMRPIPEDILALNKKLKPMAQKVVEHLEESGVGPAAEIKEINAQSELLNSWVYNQAKEILKLGKIPAVLGGDHSTPFGLLKAIGEAYKGDFGILHIDAHADLRVAYQGFTHSHASIMYNVMEKIKPARLVQVGIRDFSPDEYKYIGASDGKIQTYFDQPSKRRLNKGENWQTLCNEMVAHLPKNVHISFDIDGLSPELCPNTGTPVPGGLSFDQALTLFATVIESGRRIVSFDLNEVAEPEDSTSDWDGNVGARILFKLCGWTVASNA
jgi:agmatinase